MAKKDIFDPRSIEKKWQEYWEKEGIFTFDRKNKKKLFSIDTPPPTVSGKMHIGHAMGYTQMDFVARFKRMQGYNVFFPFGTDDNGLPTERLVEKEKKVKATKMPRDEFVKLCYDYLEENLPEFIQDWKNLGISCDWSIYYSTINKHSQKISQKSFLDLYKDGRVYRKEAPSIWCPACQTAIAQVELENKEIPSTFNDLVFKVDNKELIIATTRPEMLAACVAVFAHPDDKRYKSLIGKTAKVPVYDFEVPILADERADPEKGTGLVMCCTFGDQTDMEWYLAHNLPLKMVITKDGKMNKKAKDLEGLPLKEARKKIIDQLKEKKLLKNQKKIIHPVNVHERCKTEIEILETPQWFIKYLDKKEHFIKAGKQMNWYPDFMRSRYNNWVNGLQWDWCISRQRFFGVPFPVWYCKKCNEPVLADESQLPVDPLKDKPKKPCACGSKEYEPEKDVLDTWATSALTPQLAIELMEDEEMKKALFPMSLRWQGHDIISFWLFNTVVKSHFHHKTNPWKDIAINGWLLDPHGRKMSKSLGNIISPQDILKQYPADALRFGAGTTKLGDDLPYQEKDVKTGKRTIIKLYNAAKFSLIHFDKFTPNKKFVNWELYDKALLSKLNRIVKEATEYFEKYEYSKTKSEVELFFWHDFCDYYLEIIKDRIYNPEKRGKEAAESAKQTLYLTFLTILKLFAPIMPHITEELYQQYFKKYEKTKSIHRTSWPEVDKKLIDKDAEAVAEVVNTTIESARRAKSEAKVSLKAPIKELIIEAKITRDQFSQVEEDLKKTTWAEKIFFKTLPKNKEKDTLIKVVL